MPILGLVLILDDSATSTCRGVLDAMAQAADIEHGEPASHRWPAVHREPKKPRRPTLRPGPESRPGLGP